VSAACGQTTSLDREVKATPGREVRVGIYTSVRSDCTAGPLPAIRLSVTVRRATFKATNLKQCLATEVPAFVAFYRPKADLANDDRFELEVSFVRRAQTNTALPYHYFEWRKGWTTDLAWWLVVIARSDSGEAIRARGTVWIALFPASRSSFI
jgi:hypothetical protein